jgi:histidyl-tRNA synthetase
MALSTQPYKGARDFYPEDKRLQKYLFKKMRQTVESFGYEEYDAPILEPIDIYKAKTGDEIVNEQTYVFKDRGDREVVMRPEMTPSVSRMVAAKRQELAYPLRWYSIPNLWRYERPQRGRLREHWQLNVDIFGVEGIEAEHEIITLADNLMKSYGAKHDMYTIKINSRQLMNYLIEDYLGLDAVQRHTIMKLIDRIHKMTRAEFVADIDAILSPTERENGTEERLLGILDVRRLDDLPVAVLGHPTVLKLRQLLTLLKDSGLTNVEFDISVMRGFDYYTDIVFEMFDTDPENNRAMFGGGRYDGLVALFGVEPVATVGFGLGDVTLANFLETHQLLPAIQTETDVYVILVGDVYEAAQSILAGLRQEGVKVAVDTTGRKPLAQIKTADKKGVRYALFIGEKELADERYNLKDLKTGDEQQLGLERLVATILDKRNK